MTTALDLANLKKELETIAEYLQAGGNPKEILEFIQQLAKEGPPQAPPETDQGAGTGENEGNGAGTGPEKPPENTQVTDPPGGEAATDAGAS